MLATRPWPETLRPASYNGFPFFVDTEALPQSGRFVAVHSFVDAEDHATEDMGRKPRKFRIDAYLASDTADSDMRAFVELCSTSGVFPLVLPMLGTYQVRCDNCHVSADDRQKQGYVKLELDFIEAGTAGNSFAATPLGDRLAASAMDDMPDVAGRAVSNHPAAPATAPSPRYTADVSDDAPI